MRLNKRHIFGMIFAIAGLLVSPGCKKNPVNRLLDPRPQGVVPDIGADFIVYSNELETGGGLGFIPEATNQSIDLLDQSAPRRTTAQIRYEWNGQPVNGQQLFAGFSLLITENFIGLADMPARDLSAAEYNAITFWVRGDLSANYHLKVDGPTNGGAMATPASLTIVPSGAWQFVTLNVPLADFSAIRVWITFSLQYDQPPRTTNPGLGGVLYLDDIRYVKN